MRDIPYGCCHCGCGQKTNLADRNRPKWGHVKGEPMRYVFGHHTRLSPVEYVEDPDTNCWIWQRGKIHGYGNAGGRPAHRMVYEYHCGSIPEGLELDHICRNPACVNPGHLEAVTHAENVRRGMATRLTPEVVRDIRETRYYGSARDLAQKHGLTVTAVYCARRSKLAWREIV